MKEKLIELMIEASCKWGCQIGLYGYMADHLIANGVTFAKDNYVPNKMTNADRIRAMSDGELQAFLCGVACCETCKWSTAWRCELQEWLQQPAEEV